MTRLDKPGLTRRPLGSAWAAWAADGRHVTVRSNEDVVPKGLDYVDAFQSGERTTLFTASPEVFDLTPTSISPYGRYLLFGVAFGVGAHLHLVVPPELVVGATNWNDCPSEVA